MQAKRRVLAATVLALGVGGTALFLASGPTQSQQAASPPPAVPVKAVAAERRDVPHLFETVGTVSSLHSVVVRSQVDGILTGLHFNEGDWVEKDQLLATIDDRARTAALAAAQAQLERDRALVRGAELDLARYRSLVGSNAVSRQVLDQQIAQVDQLRASVRLAEANVETAKVNLSHTRILSPVAGRVGIRNVDVGNLVHGDDATGIVSVAQVDPISIIFPVSQTVLGDLRAVARAPGGALVEAIDRNGGGVLAQGEIIAFDNALDVTSGTARVRARFGNADEKLAPGAFVAVRLRSGVSEAAVVLPAVAVRPGIEGHFVFQVVDGTARRVPVDLGYTDDHVAVIRSGIAPGDIVVSDGYSRLIDGTRVAMDRVPETTVGSRQ